MNLRIDVLTIFPEMFEGPLSASIVGRAREAGLVDVRIRNLRDFTHDRHRVTDDTPYGGGGGMVMKVEPIVEAVESIRSEVQGDSGSGSSCSILLTPQGSPYDQAAARRYAEMKHLILICGHYEGIDERARELVVDEEVSIGDYVLTGGELPAMLIVDSVVRLLPGAVGNPNSIQEESFWNGLLDYPHYTRPEEFRGLSVPEVLLSGHHAEIDRWRRREALKRTFHRRSDLLDEAPLTEDDQRILDELRRENT